MSQHSDKNKKPSFTSAKCLFQQERKLREIENLLRKQINCKNVNEFLLLMEKIEEYRIKYPIGIETMYENRVRRMMKTYLILLKYYISKTIEHL